jgi:hypothetical protein
MNIDPKCEDIVTERHGKPIPRPIGDHDGVAVMSNSALKEMVKNLKEREERLDVKTKFSIHKSRMKLKDGFTKTHVDITINGTEGKWIPAKEVVADAVPIVLHGKMVWIMSTPQLVLSAMSKIKDNDCRMDGSKSIKDMLSLIYVRYGHSMNDFFEKEGPVLDKFVQLGYTSKFGMNSITELRQGMVEVARKAIRCDEMGDGMGMPCVLLRHLARDSSLPDDITAHATVKMKEKAQIEHMMRTKRMFA